MLQRIFDIEGRPEFALAFGSVAVVQAQGITSEDHKFALRQWKGHLKFEQTKSITFEDFTNTVDNTLKHMFRTY